MRSLQFDLPDANLSELKRITGLIRQCASPDMIVLYGRYAGGTLASALGGYELLLLTAKNLASVWVIKCLMMNLEMVEITISTSVVLIQSHTT